MKWQSHYKLTHTSGGTGVRTLVITSGLTISTFLPVELELLDYFFYFFDVIEKERNDGLVTIRLFLN